MFCVKNLRKECTSGWTYLKCDLEVTEIDNPFQENSMWIAVEEKNSEMLSDELYDPFVLVPLILGMYYRQDVKILGNISPKLYFNINHYLMNIFDNFSKFTSPIKFTVNGTKEMSEPMGDLIGTSISGGVDSLTTIYDNYVKEKNPNFRINSLFFANCGTHGDYENKLSRQIWLDRAKLNKDTADELGLPVFLIDSNLHAFTHKWREQTIGYLAIYSCILSLQKKIKRYYTSSNFSYDEIADNRIKSMDFDLAEYCESYMPHLISTERFDFVIDGCQYTRPMKTERISDWEIAQKHLNVCFSPIDHGKNCSHCHKCMWTLIPLEAMGKLKEFSEVFELETYHKYADEYKRLFVRDYGKDGMETSIVNYCRQKGMKLPSEKYIKMKHFVGNLKRHILK